MPFETLDDLLWWLNADVLDAYCSQRARDAEPGRCMCDGCPLDGCDDCGAALITLCRRLAWK